MNIPLYVLNFMGEINIIFFYKVTNCLLRYFPIKLQIVCLDIFIYVSNEKLSSKKLEI